jgi:hypothetical protein
MVFHGNDDFHVQFQSYYLIYATHYSVGLCPKQRSTDTSIFDGALTLRNAADQGLRIGNAAAALHSGRGCM